MSYSGTMRFEYGVVISMLIISAENVWDYLKQGTTIFYRWNRSKEFLLDWTILNDETVNDVLGILGRADYEFGIAYQE